MFSTNYLYKKIKKLFCFATNVSRQGRREALRIMFSYFKLFSYKRLFYPSYIQHRKGGSPPKLLLEDKLRITLKYYREYRAMESIGDDYQVSKSTVCQTIQRVEDTLLKDETSKPPGKNLLTGIPQKIKSIVVEVTESPIQRPPKTKKRIIQGKRSGIP